MKITLECLYLHNISNFIQHVFALGKGGASRNLHLFIFNKVSMFFIINLQKKI